MGSCFSCCGKEEKRAQKEGKSAAGEVVPARVIAVPEGTRGWAQEKGKSPAGVEVVPARSSAVPKGVRIRRQESSVSSFGRAVGQTQETLAVQRRRQGRLVCLTWRLRALSLMANSSQQQSGSSACEGGAAYGHWVGEGLKGRVGKEVRKPEWW